jgi:predicted nucleic acid-binding protein
MSTFSPRSSIRCTSNTSRRTNGLPGHPFWPDDISIADPEFLVPELLSSHSRVTDGYLLALARAKRGRLATMDQKLAAEVVPGGSKTLELIPPG